MKLKKFTQSLTMDNEIMSRMRFVNVTEQQANVFISQFANVGVIEDVDLKSHGRFFENELEEIYVLYKPNKKTLSYIRFRKM